MTDLTPDELERLNELTLEQIRLKKEAGELNTAELAYLEERLGLSARSLEARQRQVRALTEEQQRLEESIAIENNRYVRQQLRLALQENQNQLAAAEVGLLERQLRDTGTLSDTEAERLETAQKVVQSRKQETQVLQDAANLGKSMASSMALYGRHTVVNVDNLKKLSAGLQAPVEFLESLGTGLLTTIMDTMVNLAFQVDEMESSFRQATGASQAFTRNLTAVYDETRQYGVSAEEASAANVALYNTFTDFTLATAGTQAQLAKTTQVLGEYGVGVADVAAGIQLSTKAFGQSAEGAAQSALEINALALDLGVAPQKLAKDFAGVGGQLAKMGENGTQAFKDLALRAKVTGLEIGKLLQMTEKFDTFEGAATQAGKLNAALGGNFVNAMDLMMETDPAGRFDMLRDSILDAGLSFDDMSYYQRKFYTDALGLNDVSDLAMMLSGNYDSLTGDVGQTSAEIEAQAKQAADMKSAMEELKNALLPLIPILTGMVDKFTALAKAVERNLSWIAPLVQGFLSVWGIIKIGTIVWGAFNTVLLTFGLRSKVAARGATALGGGIGSAGAAAAPAIPVILAFGAAVAGVGAGIGLAATGMAKLVSSFADIAEVPWTTLIAGMLGLAGAVTGLAFAATLLGNPLAVAGVAVLGAASWGLSKLIGAFKKDKNEYAELQKTFTALGEIPAGGLDAAKETFASIQGSIEAMPEDKIINLGFAFLGAEQLLTSAAIIRGVMTNNFAAPTPAMAAEPTGGFYGPPEAPTTPEAPKGVPLNKYTTPAAPTPPPATAAAAPASTPAPVTSPVYTIPVELKIGEDVFESKVLTIVDQELQARSKQ
jgi:hypothetical protein